MMIVERPAIGLGALHGAILAIPELTPSVAIATAIPTHVSAVRVAPVPVPTTLSDSEQGTRTVSPEGGWGLAERSYHSNPRSGRHTAAMVTHSDCDI